MARWNLTVEQISALTGVEANWIAANLRVLIAGDDIPSNVILFGGAADVGPLFFQVTASQLIQELLRRQARPPVISPFGPVAREVAEEIGGDMDESQRQPPAIVVDVVPAAISPSLGESIDTLIAAPEDETYEPVEPAQETIPDHLQNAPAEVGLLTLALCAALVVFVGLRSRFAVPRARLLVDVNQIPYSLYEAIPHQ